MALGRGTLGFTFNLHLAASPAPEGSAPPTLREIWDAAAYGVTWFFTNLSPAFAWAVIGIALCAAFFVLHLI